MLCVHILFNVSFIFFYATQVKNNVKFLFRILMGEIRRKIKLDDNHRRGVEREEYKYIYMYS